MRRLTILTSLIGSLCLALAMSGGTDVESQSAPSRYVVVRLVFADPDQKHTASDHVYQRTVYYDPTETLLDLTSFDVESVYIEHDLRDRFLIVLPLNDKGDAALRPLRGRTGVWIDGKLVDVPWIGPKLFVIAGAFTQTEANKIAGRIKRGGTE